MGINNNDPLNEFGPFGPKSFSGSEYPVHAQDTSGAFKRAEPILTPAQVRSRYLLGIYTVFPNGDTFSDNNIQDQINLASNEAELLLKMQISPVLIKEKLDFDMSLYKAFIDLQTSNSPIISLESLAIVSTNGQPLFEIPAPWIEAALFSRGKIHVIPLLASFGTQSVAGSPIVGTQPGNGVSFFALFNAYGSITNAPSYWQVIYKTGLSRADGTLPVPVNDLIGVITAINMLSMLALVYIQTSVSLSQDGISQSSSNMGPRMYQLRIEELIAKKDKLVDEIKGLYGRRFFFSHI